MGILKDISTSQKFWNLWHISLFEVGNIVKEMSILSTLSVNWLQSSVNNDKSCHRHSHETDLEKMYFSLFSNMTTPCCVWCTRKYLAVLARQLLFPPSFVKRGPNCNQCSNNHPQYSLWQLVESKTFMKSDVGNLKAI